jgi:hypothetical protein
LLWVSMFPNQINSVISIWIRFTLTFIFLMGLFSQFKTAASLTLSCSAHFTLTTSSILTIGFLWTSVVITFHRLF